MPHAGLTFGNPPASLGFVGFMRFNIPGKPTQVRATSADIRLSQEVTAPDVIDSRFDRTVYQLGPRIVEGSASFPAIFESVGAGQDPTAELYILCVKRNAVTGALDQINIDMKYTDSNAQFIYEKCIIDQFTFSVAQQEVITITVNVIGADRMELKAPDDTIGAINNSRIVTWNDVVVQLGDGTTGESVIVTGEYLRNFDITIANNAERFYTLNGHLAPQDIAPTKRDITGTVVIMGRHAGLGALAASNEERCNETTQIKWGYNLALNPGSCQGTFLVTLDNSIFMIEELALTNDLFETTMNFRVLPNEQDLTTASVLQTG